MPLRTILRHRIYVFVLTGSSAGSRHLTQTLGGDLAGTEQSLIFTLLNQGFSSSLFCCRNTKTRGGIDAITGEDTRPYRLEFDILAVSMQPSTGKWSSFMYSVANWLIPMEQDTTKMLKFQPISPILNELD